MCPNSVAMTRISNLTSFTYLTFGVVTHMYEIICSDADQTSVLKRACTAPLHGNFFLGMGIVGIVIDDGPLYRDITH